MGKQANFRPTRRELLKYSGAMAASHSLGFGFTGRSNGLLRGWAKR